MKRKNMMIFIVAYIAYASIYIGRVNLTIASPGLIEENLINNVQIGLLGSVFFAVYAAGRLINGCLSDRYPPWFMISSGLVISGISSIVIGFFPPFAGILILWGANAYAQSMLWSSILRIISSIYDEQTAKKRTSYMVTSVATGNILGIVLNTFIVTKFGLKYAFIIPGGIILILSTLILLTSYDIRCVKVEESKRISIFRLFGNKQIQLAILPAMLHGVMKENIGLWMTIYFIDEYRIDLNQSSLFVLFIPLVGLIGRILYPVCYKICGGNEHRVSFCSFIICAVASLFLFGGTDSPVGAAVLLSLIYAAVSLINTSYLSIFPIGFLETGNVASVSGILDLVTYFGAGISAFAYGVVIEKTGYSFMFMSWAVISFVSLYLLRTFVIKKCRVV